MGCPVSGGLCGFDNRCIPCSYWWTLSSVCSSASLSKLLSFHAGWARFAKHIVTIYSDAAKRKGTSQHILIQMEINKIGHLSENCLKNIRKKGVLKWALEVSKHLHDHWWTSRTLGWNKLEHGQGLHYHELPQAPCASVAGSCSKCCKPQRLKSCLQWGRQCYLRCTRNIFRGKRTRSGCGRNQSGPRGTAMPSCGKPLKTMEKHALPSTW